MLIALGWGASSALAAPPTQTGWVVLAATTDWTGRRFALISRDFDVAIVELHVGPTVSFGQVVATTAPDDLNPTVLATNAAGQLAVGGNRPEPAGTVTVAPTLSDLDTANSPGALDALSAWALTGYDERTVRWRHRAAMFDTDGRDWEVPADDTTMWSAVLSATTAQPGPVLLVGDGGDEDATYPTRGQLVTITEDIATVTPVPMPDGHDGGHHVIATAGEQFAVVSGPAGVFVAGGPDTTVEVSSTGVAVGVFLQDDTTVVIAVRTRRNGLSTFEVTTRRGRPERIRATSEADHGLRSDDTAVVPVTGAPGERLAGSPTAGYRLLSD